MHVQYSSGWLEAAAGRCKRRDETKKGREGRGGEECT